MRPCDGSTHRYAKQCHQRGENRVWLSESFLVTDEVIEQLYGKPLVVIPKMPSLGLLLENPIFDSYSKRVETANEQKKIDPEHPDYRGPISFDRCAEDMQKFKERFIYSRMRESEEKLQMYGHVLLRRLVLLDLSLMGFDSL